MWGVAGGWAIDLWLGEETRQHHDVEVVVRRCDQALVHEALSSQWDLSCLDPPGEGWRSWGGAAIESPAFQLQARSSTIEFDIFTETTDQSMWRFRRDDRISRQLSEVITLSRSGLPIVRPEGPAALHGQVDGGQESARLRHRSSEAASCCCRLARGSASDDPFRPPSAAGVVAVPPGRCCAGLARSSRNPAWHSDCPPHGAGLYWALTKLARIDLHAGGANQPAADECVQVRVDRDGGRSRPRRSGSSSTDPLTTMRTSLGWDGVSIWRSCPDARAGATSIALVGTCGYSIRRTGW